MAGQLSHDKTHPYRATGEGLKNLSQKTLEEAFQVTAENPLIGVPGRLSLLRNLGQVVSEKKRSVPWRSSRWIG
ncbi:DUF1688 family protein [Bdellovibrio bacteriovorus]|uniref:DUF1688 family protein n=1 Tax=Bdellovibrio bacteriovorus TaxID=959 RepID=UPI0035A94BEC